MKGQARNRLTGIRTRGSPGPDAVARIIWGIDVLVSRRSTLALSAQTINAGASRMPEVASELLKIAEKSAEVPRALHSVSHFLDSKPGRRSLNDQVHRIE